MTQPGCSLLTIETSKPSLCAADATCTSTHRPVRRPALPLKSYAATLICGQPIRTSVAESARAAIASHSQAGRSAVHEGTHKLS